MRKYIITGLFLSSLIMGAIGQQVSKNRKPGFVINGHAPYLTSKYIILAYMIEDKLIHDTSVVKNGRFQFSGTLEGPVRSTIYAGAEDQRHDYTFFHNQFIENGRMTISSPTSKGPILFKGSPFNDAYESFEKELKPLNIYYGQLRSEANELKKTDSLAAAAKLGEVKDAYNRFLQTIKTYVQQHPDSDISLMKMIEISDETDLIVLQELLDLLSPRLKGSPGGSGLAKQIKSRTINFIGQHAPLFTQKNPDGEEISLASFKGKYVLIDFWASWCRPCRADNPKLLQAYKKYESRGFNILAVSLDNKESNWKEAIKSDGLVWTHVSDLQGWKNAVANQYHIFSLPTNFLVDPNGVIIAMNLRGTALDEKLADIFID